ncbi:MAG: HDOD domain-containing protein [Agitococcus sp.]|nr:HDOD domain-containing protein [Agitococcus sp.]
MTASASYANAPVVPEIANVGQTLSQVRPDSSKFPQMSDSLTRLLQLSEDERINLRILDLLVAKDPVAIVRLITLASSASFGRTKPINTVHEALQVLGATQAVDALLTLWTMASLALPDNLHFVRDHLVRHTFSSLASVRRFVSYGEYTEISTYDTQMLTLVAKISAGLVFRDTRDIAGQAALTQVATNKSHGLLHSKGLANTFLLAAGLGTAWGLPERLIDTLSELAQWRTVTTPRRPLNDMLLLAELLLDTTVEHEASPQWRTVTEHNKVFQDLRRRNIEPRSLLFKL